MVLLLFLVLGSEYYGLESPWTPNQDICFQIIPYGYIVIKTKRSSSGDGSGIMGPKSRTM